MIKLLLHAKVIINYLKETLNSLYREEMHGILKRPSLLGLFFFKIKLFLIISLLFFQYIDTKKNFTIPNGHKITDEIFKIMNGNYNANIFYLKSYSIIDEIRKYKTQKDLN